jgi:hypothetical protein
MIENVSFDEITHTYRYRGSIVPSVTQIIKGAGLSDYSRIDAGIMADAQERGRIVHYICELDDMGLLDEGTVDPSLDGYLAAWRLARSCLELKVLEVERIVYNAKVGYAGRADVVGEFDVGRFILDRKTGGMEAWHGVQLAAYAAGLNPPYDDLTLFSACLSSDGSYHIERHAFATNYQTFLAAFQVYKWKQKHNLLKGR